MAVEKNECRLKLMNCPFKKISFVKFYDERKILSCCLEDSSTIEFLVIETNFVFKQHFYKTTLACLL